MTLLEVEVHSAELELLKQAADEYDWEAIRTEVESLFKEAAIDFRDKKRQSVCPHKQKAEEDLQETFELAPVIRVEQNSEAIAAAIAGNPAFYVACGFTSHPAARTLRDFDQIMCEYGLWDLVHDIAYRKNVEDKVISESEEDILNIDNAHLLGYSTPLPHWHQVKPGKGDMFIERGTTRFYELRRSGMSLIPKTICRNCS